MWERCNVRQFTQLRSSGASPAAGRRFCRVSWLARLGETDASPGDIKALLKTFEDGRHPRLECDESRIGGAEGVTNR
jgi:hypothetical protein